MTNCSELPFKNCWEIHSCGREAFGPKVGEYGECIASKENMGHSCWAIAGTLCGDKIQGSVAEKYANCTRCEVYNLYHRTAGKYGDAVKEFFPEENFRYRKFIVDRLHQIEWLGKRFQDIVGGNHHASCTTDIRA
ncbi:MAG: hypothetical protein OEV64_04975 [Desulfobulbaceae bacterium]|nr:hypothetical protein [Desulfobulbaceae bacterium]